MNQADMLKRYGMFIAGVIFSALGISLITKAGLGTAPLTSLAYVLTFIFPYSLGTFTMIVNTIMFLWQVILLGKSFQKIQLLQVPSALLFSVCIDMWLSVLSGWNTGNYAGAVIMLCFSGIRYFSGSHPECFDFTGRRSCAYDCRAYRMAFWPCKNGIRFKYRDKCGCFILCSGGTDFRNPRRNSYCGTYRGKYFTFFH